MSEIYSQEHEQMLRCLDYGLNHERKIGTLAIVHTFDLLKYGAPRAYYITQTLNERQGGPEPVWQTGPGSVAKYLEDDFVPGNLVTKRDYYLEGRGMLKAYHPNGESSELISSLTGLGIEWSLDNPHVSVQQFLGITASSGQARAPSSRFKFYKYLLGSRDHVKPDLAHNFQRFGYKTMEGMVQQFRLMSEVGIIAVEAESSRVQLTKKVAGPIREFCASIDTVLDGRERDSYIKKLKQLAHNEAAFAKLIAKGKEFSHYHAAYVDANEIMSYISDTLPKLIEASAANAVTVQELRTDILTNYGREIGSGGLRRILTVMRKQDRIGVDVVFSGGQHLYIEKVS